MLSTHFLVALLGGFTCLPHSSHCFRRASIRCRVCGNLMFDRRNVVERGSLQLIGPTSVFGVSAQEGPKPHTELCMSKSDDDGGTGSAVTALILVGIIGIFVVSGIAPMFQMAAGPNAIDNTMSLGDAVATRSDNVKYQVAQKQLKEDVSSKMATQYEKLSRTKIQEKLNRVPVFYLTDGDENMDARIFVAFADARAEAAASDNALNVQCTTLDQVMYPLVLRRGRMRMAPPPVSIQKAESLLENPDFADSTNFQLIPSTKAQNDAANLGLNDIAIGDIPLFSANKLAFASQQGPQIPLFLDKDDCLTSYRRLKESSKNSKLEDQPTIRVTTLREVLFSMERGTRPGVSQLQFYTTESDLLRASQMIA